jgi:hypothetical protein
MSLLSFNMAVPVKDNRESQIYFLSSSENVPPTSQSVDRKYLVFKALQLVSCNYRTATNQICPKSANDVKIVYAKQRNGF